jgi:hypothetical protein
MPANAFPEFTSVREYLYLEEEIVYDRTLESLLFKVIEFYAQRIRRGTKVFTFSTRAADDALQFVVSSASRPAIGCIGIRHRTDDLRTVLSHLDAPLHALYEGTAYAPLELSRLQTTTRAGLLTSIFLPRDCRYPSVLDHAHALGEHVVAKLHEADALRARSERFVDDDPRKTLVHLDCEIKHNAGTYTFDYRVRTATLDPVPANLLAGCRGLFTLVAPSLERLTVYRPRIEEFREGNQ